MIVQQKARDERSVTVRVLLLHSVPAVVFRLTWNYCFRSFLSKDSRAVFVHSMLTKKRAVVVIVGNILQRYVTVTVTVKLCALGALWKSEAKWRRRWMTDRLKRFKDMHEWIAHLADSLKWRYDNIAAANIACCLLLCNIIRVLWPPCTVITSLVHDQWDRMTCRIDLSQSMMQWFSRQFTDGLEFRNGRFDRVHHSLATANPGRKLESLARVAKTVKLSFFRRNYDFYLAALNATRSSQS